MPLADFFTSLVKTVASFSFQLQTDDTVTVDQLFGIHPFQGMQLFEWANYMGFGYHGRQRAKTTTNFSIVTVSK